MGESTPRAVAARTVTNTRKDGMGGGSRGVGGGRTVRGSFMAKWGEVNVRERKAQPSALLESWIATPKALYHRARGRAALPRHQARPRNLGPPGCVSLSRGALRDPGLRYVTPSA